ncbi:MAG: phage tail tube protein, partial [Glaciecola sp.]
MTSPFTGSNTSHYYIVEATPGVTPANPLWTKIRNTGGIPAIIKDALISDELDDSREITGVRVGNEQAQGEYSVELSQDSQDELIANAMSSSWVAGLALSTVEVTVDETLKTFTRTAGDYVSDGVVVGDLIRFNDLTGDNAKPFIVTAVTASVVTGGAITHTLTPEVITTDIATGDTIGTGSECKTMSVLTWLRGKCGTVDKYVLTKGVEFTGFSFEVAVNAQVTGSFPLLGRTQVFSDTPPTGSTFAADLTTRAFAGVDGKVLV